MLKKQIKEILQNTKEGTKFMVFHPAQGYFANDYKLNQMPIEVEEIEPKKFIKYQKKQNS